MQPAMALFWLAWLRWSAPLSPKYRSAANPDSIQFSQDP
jgi:hypothetical protein